MQVPQTEVILRHAGAELARLTLPPGEYVIGREPAADIFAETPLLSRRHALLTINYDHLLLEDLGSANGTFVAEKPVTEVTRLFPNQAIRLGDVAMEIRRERAAAEPGVSLAPAEAAIRRFMPDEVLAKKRYTIGSQIARGGMGAILEAQQAAMKRRVAMKVMLETADPGDIGRFVDEAQITGQLDHPNIVPIHELGVDEQGHLFYTMKLVRGITLKKVLELLAEGVEATLKKYPTATLLTIFQKACDAVAFAHSRGVIHRDLKPENIMVGDFGSVLVMDWGLAKVLAHGAADASKNGAESAAPSIARSAVHTARAAAPEFGSTMAGAIMGTPQYMSPEQARGEVETLDARADIYALGAILFEMLHLRPSVMGSDAWEIVEKVARGEIEWADRVGLKIPESPATPKIRKAATQDASLGGPHAHPARDRRIPDSLRAVCRKALAFERDRRYASVEDLQRDLAAYQAGFATSAERAGWLKRASLAIKRNKAASIGAALVLLTGLTFGTRAVLEGRRAEREAAHAKAALADLKKTAPDLLALAASEAGLQRFDSALKKADAALTLDPSLTVARWRRGWVLLAQEKLAEASAALRAAAASDPSESRFPALLPLVEKMAAAPAQQRHEFELIKPIYDHLTAVGAIGEATPLLPYLKLGNEARMALVKERIDRWLGKAAYTISWDGARLTVKLNGIQLGSLEPLRGLPIDALSIAGCGVSSFEPLRGMHLVELYANGNPISDLSPLEGMPLEKASLFYMPIRDLTPLRGMPLKYLGITNGVSDIRPLAGLRLDVFECGHCPISDFSVLGGMPMRRLAVPYTRFADAQVLAGMPLIYLDAKYTRLADLTPLAALQLRTLMITDCPVRDLTPLLRIRTLESLSTTAPMEKLLPLRAHPSLQQIQIGDAPPRPVADFWAECDAQQAAGKK